MQISDIFMYLIVKIFCKIKKNFLNMQRVSLIIVIFVIFTAHSMGIVAIVGGHVISDKDMREGIAIARSPFFGKPLPDNNLKQLVLDNFIEQTLILDEAEHFGIMLSDREVVQYMVDSFRVRSIDEFAKKIVENGLSWEKVFAQAKAKLLWRQLVNEMVIPSISVSDAEIVEWHEQNNNRYGKIYNIKSLFAEDVSTINSSAYSNYIDCKDIESFANTFGLQVASDASLLFADMNTEIKRQITKGLSIGKLSNAINDNEFIVLCSVDKAKSLDDEEVYRKLFELKVSANKMAYLNKIKARYYASEQQ
ncbi:hypothetical protein CAXC1_70006 [Candidatus Xenohaliotis californiensis]|uniref:Peptidylprolyl isomerase n=1 Tax=Candidatus Xenohaliotis californiensis TaxID=84677 RepID=A0ABP0EXD1_9RICK|nr:hypothetical protein CAXC1_70006 [Candidatus Xenohaliotis californiensis]